MGLFADVIADARPRHPRGLTADPAPAGEGEVFGWEEAPSPARRERDGVRAQLPGDEPLAPVEESARMESPGEERDRQVLRQGVSALGSSPQPKRAVPEAAQEVQDVYREQGERRSTAQGTFVLAARNAGTSESQQPGDAPLPRAPFPEAIEVVQGEAPPRPYDRGPAPMPLEVSPVPRRGEASPRPENGDERPVVTSAPFEDPERSWPLPGRGEEAPLPAQGDAPRRPYTQEPVAIPLSASADSRRGEALPHPGNGGQHPHFSATAGEDEVRILSSPAEPVEPVESLPPAEGDAVRRPYVEEPKAVSSDVSRPGRGEERLVFSSASGEDEVRFVPPSEGSKEPVENPPPAEGDAPRRPYIQEPVRAPLVVSPAPGRGEAPPRPGSGDEGQAVTSAPVEDPDRSSLSRPAYGKGEALPRPERGKDHREAFLPALSRPAVAPPSPPRVQIGTVEVIITAPPPPVAAPPAAKPKPAAGGDRGSRLTSRRYLRTL